MANKDVYIKNEQWDVFFSYAVITVCSLAFKPRSQKVRICLNVYFPLTLLNLGLEKW